MMTFQQQLFDVARDFTNQLVLNGDATSTKAGSVKHWLKGSEPSDQAYSIKFGKVGEALAQWFIEQSPNSVELLSCGVKKMYLVRRRILTFFGETLPQTLSTSGN